MLSEKPMAIVKSQKSAADKALIIYAKNSSQDLVFLFKSQFLGGSFSTYPQPAHIFSELNIKLQSL